jgi:hypothetical protein
MQNRANFQMPNYVLTCVHTRAYGTTIRSLLLRNKANSLWLGPNAFAALNATGNARFLQAWVTYSRCRRGQ